MHPYETTSLKTSRTTRLYFNLYAPHAIRNLLSSAPPEFTLRFQSSHPIWGATSRRRCHTRAGQISIHAPRVGRDSHIIHYVTRYRAILCNFRGTILLGASISTRKIPLCRHYAARTSRVLNVACGSRRRLLSSNYKWAFWVVHHFRSKTLYSRFPVLPKIVEEQAVLLLVDNLGKPML